MRIGICEDKATELAVVKTALEKVLLPGDTLDCFGHGAPLLEQHCKAAFDILLLDIGMPGLSGIDVAKEIRQSSQKTVIIFLSIHREFGPEAYKLGALYYLLKPIREEDVVSQIRRARRKFANDGFTYEIKGHDGLLYLPGAEILYIESYGRRISIHTVNGIYQTGRRLKQVTADLEGHGFFRLHQSYVINLRHVKCIKDRHVWLDDNIMLPLGSRLTMSEIQAVVTQYRRARYALDGY